MSNDRKRVMGVACKSEEDQRFSKVEHLTWQVPTSWSLEEAATVPLAGSMAYYSLFLMAKVRRGHCVLVQAGWTSFSQVAIALALNHNCTVFTTVANNEQRTFIKKQFPQIPDQHILNIKTFHKELLSETQGQGVDVILNTLSGGNLNRDVCCIAESGCFVQLAKNDLAKNKILGMFMFTKNTSFYGVGVEHLFGMSPEMKKELHSGVQEKIKSGVIKPLHCSVFNKQQSQIALRDLFNVHHVGKILLQASKENIPTRQPNGFKCEPQNTYLVSGGNAEQCLDVCDWLVTHGARRLMVALHSKTVSGQFKRRVGLLKSYHKAQLAVKFTPPVTSATSAASLLQFAVSSLGGNISAIFILPPEMTGQENGIATTTVSCLDIASRNISTLRHFVCLLSEGSWASCEARHRAGFPAVAVHWTQYHSKSFNLRNSLQVLDTILTTEHHGPVVTISEESDANRGTGSSLSLPVLDEYLPPSLEELSDFGEDVQSCSSCCLEELTSQSPGYNFVKEVPPVFMIPGLQGSAAEALHPLARQIMFPVFCAKLPSKIQSITDMAATLAQLVRGKQKSGPYNLIGVSWGGALTLELAQKLEAEGQSTRVVLVDGALETMLSAVGHLGDGPKMQADLICRLLQISNPKVQEELIQYPDLPSQLNRALSEIPQEMKKNELYIRAGITAVADRIIALLQYQHPNMLLNGEVILIRPTGEAEDNCGLTQFFRQTVNISMVDGNHRTILSNNKVAETINSFVL